jgi:hypothetical protein
MWCTKCMSSVCNCSPKSFNSIPTFNPITSRPIFPTADHIANPMSRLLITNPLSPMSPFGPGKPPIR